MLNDTTVSYFVTVDGIPYKIVYSERFQHFIQIVKPVYKLPSRRKLSDSLIPKIFRNEGKNKNID